MARSPTGVPGPPSGAASPTASAEGAIWVADPLGRRVLRLREGGAITHSIDLAPRGAYACMLGGADRKTLYVITNNVGVANEGRIETMRVDVPAAGWP